MTIAKLALDQAGRVVVIDDQTGTLSGAPHIAAQAYDSTYQALWVDTGAVNATADHYNNGLRFTTVGALRIYDATAGLPATTNTHLGMAMTTDGQVCVTSGASTSPYVLNGVAMTNDGRVYVDILSFALEFADLGAGVVSTVEAIGGATPTFTRATAATTVLSTGLIGAVASGDPRSYYDPTTLDYLGYLAEGARTNLCLQSEDFSTTWTDGGANLVTVDVDATTSPDGTSNADRLTASAGGSSSRIQTIAVANAVHSFSVWFKGDTATGVDFGIFQGAAFVAITATKLHGSGSIAITSDVARVTGLSTSSWTRFQIVTNAALSAANASIFIYPGGIPNNTGAVFAWGAQLEAASFASSYIPTTTLAVARNADVLTYSFAAGSTGTFLVQAVTAVANATDEVFISSDDGTANERIFLSRSAAGNAQLSVIDGGVAQAALSAGALANSTSFKFAATYAVNDFADCFNGGTVATDTSGTIPTMTTLRVGVNVASTVQPYSPIRRVEYYANRMPNAVLQALTNGSR